MQKGSFWWKIYSFIISPSFSSGRRITHEIIIKNKTVAWPESMIYEILEFSDRLGTCFRPNLPNRLENLWTYFWNIGRYVNLVERFMIITLSTVSIYKLEWIVSLNIKACFIYVSNFLELYSTSYYLFATLMQTSRINDFSIWIEKNNSNCQI